MIITPHIVTGMVIGKELGNPFLVSVLALSSHFVLDIIPHWQENRYPWTLTKKTYIRIFLDIVVSIFIISMVKSKIGLNPNIILGIFFYSNSHRNWFPRFEGQISQSHIGYSDTINKAATIRYFPNLQ